MNRFLSSLLISFATIFSIQLKAQSPLFTQQFTSPTYSNPNLVGWHGGLGIYSHYRNQWPGLPVSFNTINVGADGYVDKLRSGFGINIQHDRLGGDVVINNNVDLHWSPNIKMGDRTILSPSLSLNYLNTTIDWSQMTFGDAIDRRTGFMYNAGHYGSIPITNNASAIGFSLGAAILTDRFIFSVHSSYINQPNLKFFNDAESRMPRVYRISMARRFDISDDFNLTPTLSYTRQYEFNHLSLAMNANYKNLVAGMMYRLNDRLVYLAGYDIAETVRITYSYDMTVSQLDTQTLGSHEIGVRTLLFKNKRKKQFIKDLPVL